MRNLLEYPITYAEKTSWLDKQLNEWLFSQNEDEFRCGDVTGAIIYDILEDLARLQDLIES